MTPNATKCPVALKTTEPLPVRMRHLFVDERGYVVPWFVAWVDGKPEFRAMDPDKFRAAITRKLCWVCGQRSASMWRLSPARCAA
jgi:hypothetical protein